MLGFNGGLIGVSRRPQNGQASGLWIPQEQSAAARDNAWPATSYTARYWRWTNFTTNATTVEVSEFRLSNAGSYITGGTWLASGANFASFTAANMNNNVLNARAVQFNTPNNSSSIYYDYGSAVTADGWQYATYANAGANLITAATLQISNDGITFFPIKTFSDLSRYTVTDSVISPIYPLAPPTGYSYRYFRFTNFASTALNGDALDLSEIQFFNSDFSQLTGITSTSNITWSGGLDSYLADGTISASTNRSYKTSWDSVRSSSTMSFDLGSKKTVRHIRVISCFTQPRFPASFDLQGSDDGSTYTTLATVTVGTPATAYGTNLTATAIVAI
jgi:hypothetical protein